MASSSARPAVLASTALVLFLLLCLGPSAISGNKLRLMLQRREAPAPKKTDLAVEENKAQNFLGSLKRQRRQLWDPTWSNTQQGYPQWDPQWDPQWNPQLPHTGFDEVILEGLWLNDESGHDYSDYHSHHNEDAAAGPQSPDSSQEGASDNYDDY
ncbi:PREDICTED: augurin-like [Miniopterus natalensis]|uniref:augurin-like n=1 Tax=Miniopterus natalensis TaxID=291302 RepID=UPI0007A729D4|nr:PREDICTED: augurin-like [Miniopterus natalensis]